MQVKSFPIDDTLLFFMMILDVFHAIILISFSTGDDFLLYIGRLEMSLLRMASYHTINIIFFQNMLHDIFIF